MAQAAPTAVAAAAPKAYLVALGEKLLGEKSFTAETEKALQALHDDEYERLTTQEKRAFFGDAVRRELARHGLGKGALAMASLNADTPTAIALAQLEKQDPKAKDAVAKALARLRTVAIDCVACECLVMPRFKAEDDRCRVCGELLPIAATFGEVEDAAHVAALIDEGMEVAPVAAAALAPDTSPPQWEVVAAKPDATRFLKLSPDNQDWDEVQGAKKKAQEEVVAKQRAAEEAKRRAEEEVKAKARAEEELRRKQEEEVAAAKAKAEEDERQRKLEQERPAVGVLTGINAGQFVRIADLDLKLKPSANRPLPVIKDGKAKLLVPSAAKTWINDKKVAGGSYDLAIGDVVRGLFEDDDLALIDATGELQGVNADPVHFKRDDEIEGGPWNYWNEPAKIGTAQDCEIFLNDDGVDEHHALVATRFGRVVAEDTCKHEDGLWIGGERRRSILLKPDTKFRLGSKGPTLAVLAGQVEVKEAPVATGPMKPARYVRTVLHVQTTRGEQQKVFLFARREVRFGKLFSRDELKVENDLVIAPADDLQTVGDKQGSFTLNREGVTVRRDDRKIEMSVNDEELAAGQSVLLKREFTIEIGVGVVLHGQVYRAPASAKRPDGPPQLGIEGGHPNECVKMVREGDDSGHTYVFLVRQLRLGSGQTDSIQLPGINVAPGHAVVQLSRGVLQIIAPRDKHKVKLDGQVMKTGVPYPLKLGAKILMGECLIRFEVTQESDFKVQAAAVS